MASHMTVVSLSHPITFSKPFKKTNISFHKKRNTTYGLQGKATMLQAQHYKGKYMIRLVLSYNDLNRSKRETKPNVRCTIDNLECETFFTPKLLVSPEYRTLFEQQGFLMQGSHRVYFLMALE